MRVLRWALAGAVVGLIVGSTVGAIAGVAVGAARVWLPRVLLWAAFAAPVLMAAVTLVERPLGEGGISSFSTSRPVAHAIGVLTIVVWLGAAVVAWHHGDQVGAAESETGGGAETDGCP